MMETFVIGLWGCYFGTSALMLVGSTFAFTRSLRRVSVNAGLSTLVSVLFVVAFLDGFPISDVDTKYRFLAHVSGLVSTVLAYLLLAMLGLLKSNPMHLRAALVLGGLSAVVLGAGWLLEPLQALALSLCLAGLLGIAALGICLRRARNGDRLASIAGVGIFFMLVAMAGLGWIAMDRQYAPMLLHAISALCATLYLVTIALVVWARYTYLIELHEVRIYGPGYDPVTRMRSHAETGHMVGEVFRRFRDAPAPLGVIVVTIANLYALEKLHGLAAVNSALFVCAGRLRRAVPSNVEMGRLGNDGFLLIMPNCDDNWRLVNLARSLESRLRKSVTLSTRLEMSRFEIDNTLWVAEIGVGLMIVSSPTARGPSAIAMARGLSRTAMSYVSRIACFDQSGGGIVELPVLASAQVRSTAH